MSKEELAGIKADVTKLLLAENEAGTMASLLASLAPLAKAEQYSPAPLAGDAKGLSGRLCSKLQSIIRLRNLTQKSKNTSTITEIWYKSKQNFSYKSCWVILLFISLSEKKEEVRFGTFLVNHCLHHGSSPCHCHSLQWILYQKEHLMSAFHVEQSQQLLALR